MNFSTCCTSLIIFKSIKEVKIKIRVTLTVLKVNKYFLKLKYKILFNWAVLLPFCKIKLFPKRFNMEKLLKKWIYITNRVWILQANKTRLMPKVIPVNKLDIIFSFPLRLIHFLAKIFNILLPFWGIARNNARNNKNSLTTQFRVEKFINDLLESRIDNTITFKTLRHHWCYNV